MVASPLFLQANRRRKNFLESYSMLVNSGASLSKSCGSAAI